MFLNAKACYDRIITSLSNIIYRSQGLSKEIAALYVQTLDLIEYHPKHQLGICEQPNGNNKPKPFHGSGQGSGDGGTRWGMITDKLIILYNKICNLTTITSPLSKAIIQEGIRIFVDDASLMTQQNNNNFNELAKQLENNIPPNGRAP